MSALAVFAQSPSIQVLAPPSSGSDNTHFLTYVLPQSAVIGVTTGDSWFNNETTTAAALTTPCTPNSDVCQQDPNFPTLYHTYNFASMDAILAPWFATGKKVNILLTLQTNGPNTATPYYLTTSTWTGVAGTQHYINVAKDTCSQDAGVAITTIARLTGGSNVATVTQNNSYNAGDTVWLYGQSDSTFSVQTQAGVQIISANSTSWTYHSGATNAVSYSGSNAGFSETQVQSWFVPTDAGYTSAMEAFAAALVYHFNHSPNLGQIGYLRGMPAARGGEVVQLCPDQMVADGFPGYASQAQAKTTWLNWYQTIANYIGTLNPKFQFITAINPGWTGAAPDQTYGDAEAGYAIAVNNAFGHRGGFGSQGLQATDLCSTIPPPPYSSADWVNAANNYFSGGLVSAGTQPIEGQQIDRSDPTAVYNASCVWVSGLQGVNGFQGGSGPTSKSKTGSLVAYLPYAKAQHLTTLELYPQDAFLAFDPTYCVESSGACGAGSYSQAVFGMRCQGPTSAVLPTCPGGHGDGTYAAALGLFAAHTVAFSGGVKLSGNIKVGISGVVTFPADFFISPAGGTPTSPCSNGSDTNDGTSASASGGHGPFATWAHAINVIQAAGLFGSKPLTIAFCQSTVTSYGNSITLNGSDSGTAAAPVTWRNYPGQSPVISGGTQVTGLTVSTTGTCSGLSLPAGSHCYQVTLPGGTPYFERLWYNGQLRFRPRMGATAGNLAGAYGHSKSQLSGTSNGCSNSNICGMVYCTSSTSPCPGSDPVSNWASCASNPCEIYGFAKWTASVLVISSINTSSSTVGGVPGHAIITTCTTCTAGGFGGVFQAGFRYIVDNVKELLQFPGQWYYDQTTRQLTYISNSGENPATDLVEVGNQTQLLTGSGLSYTTISGLTLEHDNYNLPAGGMASTQLDPNLTGALITCDACNHVTLSGNIIAHTTNTAIHFTGLATNNTISGNQIYDIGGYGVRWGFQPAKTTCSGSCTNSNTFNNNTTSGNWIWYVSRYFPSADNIEAGLGNANTYSNNDLRYAYDKGFEICEPNCTKNSAIPSNNLISGNDISHIGQGVMTDLACVYMATSSSTNSGTGNILTGNRCHDVNGSFLQGDPSDIAVHAFYLDGQTGNWTVTNNLGYRFGSNGVHQNEGPNVASQPNIIQNNILANTANYSSTGACVGIQTPTASVLSFTYQSNLCYEANASYTLVNWGVGPPSSGSTAQQNFVSNLYFFSGTPSFNVKTGGNVSFSTWKSTYLEDTAGTITTNPGFNHPNACAAPYDPTPGTCDDFTFINGTIGPGFGFTVFSQTFGPGSSPSPAIPAVPATFPEAICQTTGSCSF